MGRFNVLDPMAELAPDFTPYRYGFNNPVFWQDASGLFESYDAATEYMKANGILGATIEFDGDSNLWKINDGISIIAQVGEAINRTYLMDDGSIYVEQTRAGGKSNLEKGLRTVADFTPFIGGAWDVVEGLENGDYLQVTIGAGSLILDAATMGVGGTILKGGLKTVIKEGAEELAEQGLKKVAKTVDPSTLVRTETGRTWRESTRNVADIMNSAKTEGILKPVDIFIHNGDSYIINGHHRVHAAMRLGQQVPVNYLSTPGTYSNVFGLQMAAQRAALTPFKVDGRLLKTLIK